MNRRTFLTATGTTLITIGAGCITTSTPPSSASNTMITDRTFTLTDSPDVTLLRSGPRITFDTKTDRVIVEGAIEVGSEKCKKAALKNATYNPSADTLKIVVTHAKSASHPDNNLLGGSCDDSMSVDYYRATITCDNDLPRKVTVIEHSAPGGHPPRTQTTSKLAPNEDEGQ